MAETVLAQIAASFSQKENLATEALAFILNRSPEARVALQRQLELALELVVGQMGQVARVATQVAAGAESRPDLSLLAEDGKLLGYLEAKFWAGLTEAQPKEYVRRLSDGQGGGLLFLAPERRLPLLFQEICDRLEVQAAGTRCVSVGPVRVGVLSWSKLLSALREATSHIPQVASDIHQLQGLVAQFEADAFLPLTSQDLDDLNVPRLAVAFADLASAIVEAAVKRELLEVKIPPKEGSSRTSQLRVTYRQYGAGRYARFKWAGCWVGVNYKAWARWGRGPMWVEFADDDWGRARKLREPLRAWLHGERPRAFEDDDGALQVPLLLKRGAERDAVIEAAVDQLRELHEALRDAGLAPVTGEPSPQQ